MNLAHYFDKVNNNVTNINSNKISKKAICNKQFTNKMNKFLSNNLIDMVDYQFMLDFLKTKGTIVNTQKYRRIYNNIMNNENIVQEDKDELTSYCKILFDHLDNLFDNNIEGVDSVKVNSLIEDITFYMIIILEFLDCMDMLGLEKLQQ